MSRLEEELHKDAVCHQFYSTYIVNMLPRKLLKVLGDFKVGGQTISTVRYADDLLLLAKEETILLSIIDKLIEVGREYGMEINVEKTKTMRISRQQTSLQIKIDKTLVEITNDARCTREIKARIASALIGGEWSTSRPGRFTPRERAPDTHWIGGWVDLRAGLDDLEKRKFLTLPGL
jgi:hypothetical protein